MRAAAKANICLSIVKRLTKGATANLNGHEVGNGGYSQGESKATAPVLYSTPN